MARALVLILVKIWAETSRKGFLATQTTVTILRLLSFFVAFLSLTEYAANELVEALLK